jgi:hypothetical protein
LGVVRWYMAYVDSLRGTLPGYFALDWRLDWRALACSALLTLASALLFGLAPALNATRDDIASALKSAVPSRLRARRWFCLRNILVAHQVAASMVLLLLTGFIVIGIRRASSGDPGFDYKHLYLLSLDPVRDGYDAKRAADYFDKLPQRLARLPGVAAVSVAQTLPLALSGVESLITAKVELTGGPKALGAIRSDRVGPGFFETVGIPMLRGRGTGLAGRGPRRPDAGLRGQAAPGDRGGARYSSSASAGAVSSRGVPAERALRFQRPFAARRDGGGSRAAGIRRSHQSAPPDRGHRRAGDGP